MSKKFRTRDYYEDMLTAPIPDMEEDKVEFENPKADNRDRWEGKHRKDKDYNKKYGRDDDFDDGWN